MQSTMHLRATPVSCGCCKPNTEAAFQAWMQANHPGVSLERYNSGQYVSQIARQQRKLWCETAQVKACSPCVG